MSTLFNQDGTYTELGREIDKQTMNFAYSLMRKLRLEGCSAREISHIMIHTITMAECRTLVQDQGNPPSPFEGFLYGGSWEDSK